MYWLMTDCKNGDEVHGVCVFQIWLEIRVYLLVSSGEATVA
jgi:hypothetical protein